MQEGDRVSVCAFTRLFVDKPNALRLQPCEFALDVLDAVGDVMQFVLRIAAKPLDCRVGGERLQQLDDGRTGGETDDFDALVGDDFMIHAAQTERHVIKPSRLTEIGDDDSDMIELAQSTSFSTSCARRQARILLAQAMTSPAT